MGFATGSLLKRKLTFQPLCFRCYATGNVIIMFMIVIWLSIISNMGANSSEKVLLTQTTHVWYIHLRTFTINISQMWVNRPYCIWMIWVKNIYYCHISASGDILFRINHWRPLWASHAQTYPATLDDRRWRVFFSKQKRWDFRHVLQCIRLVLLSCWVFQVPFVVTSWDVLVSLVILTR